MFNTTIALSLGLLLLVVVVLYNTPSAKAARKRRAEEYQRQEDKRSEKEKTEVARKAKQMENFRKQRLVVYIREKDGRKSSFEAVLIKMLLKSDIAVEPLPENIGRIVAGGDTSSLKNGLVALVGTSWQKSGTGTDYEYGFSHKWTQTHCDYRLLATTSDGVGKILGAGYDHWNSSYEETLANSIIENLASTLRVET